MSSALVFEADLDANRLRLDHFLVARLPQWSRARLQSAIHEGSVWINGIAITRPSAWVLPGAHVELRSEPQAHELAAAAPEDLPLRVLYEDDDIVAIDKEAGMAVHSGAGIRHGTLVNALLFRYASLSAGGSPERPGIVHRLDRLTSGVIIVARNDWTHQHLAEQFQSRTVRKVYLALAHGLFRDPSGEIDLPIHRDLHQRVRMTTRRRGGRDARTSCRVLESYPHGRYSWLHVRIHTGRTHQIRVHFADLGHPIVGDRLYGAPAILQAPPAIAGFHPERVYLHAAELELTHPRTGLPLILHAPVPAELDDIRVLLSRSQE